MRVSPQRYQDLDSVSESKLSRGEQGGESIVSWSIWLNLRKTERDNFTFFIIPCTFKLSFTLNLCMSRRQRWGWPFSAARNKAWSPFRSLLPGCLQTDSLFCKYCNHVDTCFSCCISPRDLPRILSGAKLPAPHPRVCKPPVGGWYSYSEDDLFSKGSSDQLHPPDSPG